MFSKDTKVRNGPAPKLGQTAKGLYSYPDLLVVCGELKFHDEYRDVLLNPAVIIEVLSPATEGFDRGEKWARYQTWLPELTDYFLVSQTKPRIDHFHRRAGGEWVYSLVNNLGESLRLASIGCVRQLTDVCDQIIFPAKEPEDLSEE